MTTLQGIENILTLYCELCDNEKKVNTVWTILNKFYR